MGRSKDLRRRISGLQRTIEEHETKIRAELTRPHPNEEYIRGWRHEIDVHRSEVARLTRRLTREW